MFPLLRTYKLISHEVCQLNSYFENMSKFKPLKSVLFYFTVFFVGVIKQEVTLFLLEYLGADGVIIGQFGISGNKQTSWLTVTISASAQLIG